MAKATGRAHAALERVDLAAIVESSHDAIIGLTRAGVISSWNPAAARLYGYPAAEVVGRPAQLLIPADRQADEAAMLRRILAGEVVGPHRTDRVCRDGTVITVSSTISPIVDRTGAIVGAATACRRASDLQEAQDRFELRVGQERAEAVDASDRFEAQVEEQRAEAVDASDRFEARVDERRAEAHDASDRFEERVDKERGRAQDAQDRFHARGDSERAAAKSDLEHLQAQLHQAQRLEVLGHLAGGVAHDFNNLLAVILNYSAFVVEELAAEELAAGPRSNLQAATRDVTQIQRAAERATALTHQLLAFARREIVQPRVLDLNEVIAEVQQLLRRTLGEDVVLETELAADLWPVLADEGQIEQVLVNLAINARDAMPRGGTLNIDTVNVMVADGVVAPGPPVSKGRKVRLRVSDTGTGMPADVVDHVFEPFYTTKADGTGTGLGLATVYGIVAQAEGAIAIDSQVGVGTTFTIMFPVTNEVAAPIDEPVSYQRTPTGETVLVVEDEDALREVTKRIFTRVGYNVITAPNGSEAVTLAAHHDGEIHLLVTDVVMPNMLGKEVAEMIRRFRPDIEVLYMSGYAQPVLASQGRLDPNVNLIEKPFTAAGIVERAGRILNGHFQGFETVETADAAPVDIQPPSGSDK